MASIMCHRLPPFTADQIEPALMSKGPFMLEAFALAMLIYVLSISSIRLVAEKTGDIIHTNQVGICTSQCRCLGIGIRLLLDQVCL